MRWRRGWLIRKPDMCLEMKWRPRKTAFWWFLYFFLFFKIGLLIKWELCSCKHSEVHYNLSCPNWHQKEETSQIPLIINSRFELHWEDYLQHICSNFSTVPAFVKSVNTVTRIPHRSQVAGCSGHTMQKSHILGPAWLLGIFFCRDWDRVTVPQGFMKKFSLFGAPCLSPSAWPSPTNPHSSLLWSQLRCHSVRKAILDFINLVRCPSPLSLSIPCIALTAEQSYYHLWSAQHSYLPRAPPGQRPCFVPCCFNIWHRALCIVNASTMVKNCYIENNK